MTQDPMTDVDILAIKDELSETLNFSQIINIFVHQTARKARLI